MKRIFRASHTLAHGLHMVSGVLLVAMVATVLLDVLSRSVFGATNGEVDLTFPGGVEIVSYSLLFAVLLSLPYSVNRGQVIVDIFTEVFPERVKRAMAASYNLGFTALGFGMAVAFFHSVGSALDSGETTQDLHIPLYLIYAAVSAITAVLGLRALLVSIEQVLDTFDRPRQRPVSLGKGHDQGAAL
ncbi:MAG: TRAP transporter small permease [Rhodospirillaceae bacterium]|nr:TRAP transporter small permease [Rhodospirillaceae bacterium]